MAPKKARPKTTTEYINAAPKEARAKLRQLGATIGAAGVGATESLKWGMPSFSFRRILVTFAAHKNHIGLYPTPSAVKAFADVLRGLKTATGSIQFPLAGPLPVALIRKITAYRVREATEEDGKWRR